MSAENAVKKWESCVHGVEVSADEEEAVHIVHDEGGHVDYSCDHQDVVAGAARRKRYTLKNEDGTRTPMVELHPGGKVDDPDVIEALTKTCATCSNYKKRE